MGAVNGVTKTFMATPRQLDIIDVAKQIHYSKSGSEVIRMLIDAGAKTVIGETAAKKIEQKYER